MGNSIYHTGFMHVITPHAPRADGREFATYQSPSASGGGWEEDYLCGGGAYDFDLIEKVNGEWVYVTKDFGSHEGVLRAASAIPDAKEHNG